MISAVIIVPADQLEAVNAALELEGYGPSNLSVPMRGTVRVESEEQATHYGCHWWIGSDFDAVSAIVESVTTDAVIVHDGVIDDETVETRIGFELFDGQAGDYIYVMVDPQAIDALNLGLGKLTGTNLPYSQVITHPENWPLLQLREHDVVPIGLGSDPNPLVTLLQGFVDMQVLQQEELDKIIQEVQDKAGQQVRVREFIPKSWEQYIYTREQAENSGYFGATL
jgi:hypothetical protein